MAAFSRATLIAWLSMSVAMHFASGHSASAAKERMPGPGPDVGDVAEARAAPLDRVQRLEAAGSRRMLARAEGEAGVDLERGRARRHGPAVHRRVDIEAAGADRLQSGLAHRHPIGLTQLLDPAVHRCPARQSSPARRRAAHDRNKRGSAIRRASTGPAHRRPAPAGSPHRETAPPSAIASPCARVQAIVTRDTSHRT